MAGPLVRLIVIFAKAVALTVKAPGVESAMAVTGSMSSVELLPKVSDLATPSPPNVPAEVTVTSELSSEALRTSLPA